MAARVVSAVSIVENGMVRDTATAAQLQAAQTPGTHVGTLNADVTLPFNGQTLSFYNGKPFIADGALYAAINASPLASLVVWID